MTPFGDSWSRDFQLVWWGGLEPGDRLELEVPVAKAGTYTLTLHVSRAEDYGIFGFALDGGPESAPRDFFNPRLLAPVQVTLGPTALGEGVHRLTVVYHGKNPRSTNSLIGIDCLELDEAPR